VIFPSAFAVYSHFVFGAAENVRSPDLPLSPLGLVEIRRPPGGSPLPSLGLGSRRTCEPAWGTLLN
jgi:hypothetical protein